MFRLYSDPYKILGLRPDATEKEIRRAHRRLAMQHHPDRKPNDPEAVEKFKQIQRAHEILTRKKVGTSISGTPGQYESPFSDDIHPFFGFFRAMRNYYAGKKE